MIDARAVLRGLRGTLGQRWRGPAVRCYGGHGGPERAGRRRRPHPWRTGPIRPRTTCSSTAATPRSSPPPTTPSRRSALDVDTGSFHVGKAQLDGGTLPDPASIRVEEWVNAFDYGDPGRRPAACSASIVETGPRRTPTTARTRARRHHARPSSPTRSARRRASRSSSTRRARWTSASGSGLVKSSLALLVQHLRPADTVAIVTYGDEAAAGAGADAGRRRPSASSTPSTSSARAAARTWRPGCCSATSRPVQPFRPDAAQRRRAGLRRRRQRRRHRPDRARPSRSRRPARRASTSSPSATAWATTTTT